MAGKFLRKTKRHFYRYLILVILVIIVGLLFFVGFKSAKQVKNSSLWYFKKINLVLIGEESVSIFSLEGNDSRLMEFSFQEKVDLPRGFGEYELGKVYRLGELEKRGGQLTLETFQNSLNIPVMGYFYQDGFNAKNFTSPASFKKIVNQSIKKRVKTNLHLIDLLVLYFRGKKLSPVLFKKYQYNPGPDDFFKDEQIRREALAVEILNGTQHPGLAQKAAVFWENLGGRVIRVADYNEQLTKNLLVVKGGSNKSYSYKIIKNFFKPDCRELSEEENRADMTLILGEDYWKTMMEKW